MLADMSIGVETARLAWMKSAWAADHNLPTATVLASIAKCYAADVANKCATNAVQVYHYYATYLFFLKIKMKAIILYSISLTDLWRCWFQHRVSGRKINA